MPKDNPDTFLTELTKEMPSYDLEEEFKMVTLSDGETLFEQGAPSREMFVLLEGRATAILGSTTANPLTLARFEPGALIGEMAFYQTSPRSAKVIAEGRAVLLRIETHDLQIGSRFPEAFIISFHSIVARYLSKRLERATRLLWDAQI